METDGTPVHHPFILGTVVLALTVCSSARTGYYLRNYEYSRPGCHSRALFLAAFKTNALFHQLV